MDRYLVFGVEYRRIKLKASEAGKEKIMSKPKYVRESERLLTDCGIHWCNALDLYEAMDRNPDLADVIQDVIDWTTVRPASFYGPVLING